MIIVKILGGMGNQMFQYAMAKALALRTGHELKLDTRSLISHGERPFELNNLSIFASEAVLSDFSKLGFSLFSYPLIRLKKHPAYYLEKNFSYNHELFNQTKSIYLDGYFQSEKYFLPCENEIRKEFTFKSKLNQNEIKYWQSMQTSQSVSLHIRRGDYVGNSILAPLPMSYYEKAILQVVESLQNPHFFVFSDDLKWAKENLNLHHPVTYVEGHIGNDSYRDMRLMSLCKHHIIANSSFSWWGAWLNASPDKLVFAPKDWFSDKSINDKDLIPTTWIKVI
jgi:hypothetical protein